MTDQRREFLYSMFLSNTQQSAFQRGRVYAEENSVTKEYKLEAARFIADFQARLRALEVEYRKPVSEDKHLENIKRFSDELSAAHPMVLRKGRLRIGTAQKAVNLYLKYLWCAGWIVEPPHCPLDGIILAELGLEDKWTALDDPGRYAEIMDIVHQKAQVAGLNSASWELNFWNSMQSKT